jgi:uncharacterized secreted protein with C-terminal beta-propeller domain
MLRPTRRPLALLVGGLLLLAACTDTSGSGSPTGSRPGDPPAGADLAFALASFDDCGDFESRVQSVAADAIGPWGFDGGGDDMAFTAVGRAMEDQASAVDAPESQPGPSTTTLPTTDAALGSATREGGGEWTGTNVQEQGVDEPDLVKVDGNLVLTLVDGELRAVRLVDGQPELVGSLSMPAYGDDQLLADGDTVLVLTGAGPGIASRGGGFAAESSRMVMPSAVTLRSVDVSDPAAMSITGEVSLEGSMVDARMIDGVVRLVTTTGAPDLPLVQPAGSGPRAQEAAERLNREAIEATTADDWLPRYEVADAEGDLVDEGPLVECEAVHTTRAELAADASETAGTNPIGPSAFGMVNVVSVDLRSGALAPSDAVSVMGSGHTLYASPTSLYVATTTWDESGLGSESTQVHQFDTSSRETVSYVASGQVDGHLLNQFALSEHNGHLRVATTRTTIATSEPAIPPEVGVGGTGGDGTSDDGRGVDAGTPQTAAPETTVPTDDPPTESTEPQPPESVPGPTVTTTASVPATSTTVPAPTTTLMTDEPLPAPPIDMPETDSVVTVLRNEGGELRKIGAVGGLGLGEQIQSVRFMGDIGYVVTFRQIDPLYTIDLRDPSNPRVLGELKIPGFSSYLHPIGDGLLLGIGRDADLSGRTTGMQVTVFDVADLANPTELQRVSLPDASSEAEWDHHAFLWWPETSTVVVPVQEFAPTGVFTGAIGYRVGRAGIGELGRVTHPEDPTFINGSCPPGADCPAPAVELSFGGTPIRRSLVVDGRLVTISSAGLETSSLDTLTEIGWLAF